MSCVLHIVYSSDMHSSVPQPSMKAVVNGIGKHFNRTYRVLRLCVKSEEGTKVLDTI